MSQPDVPGSQKPLKIEYIRYEAPTILDAEALSKSMEAGTCGVCITGGSAVAEAEAAPQDS